MIFFDVDLDAKWNLQKHQSVLSAILFESSSDFDMFWPRKTTKNSPEFYK